MAVANSLNLEFSSASDSDIKEQIQKLMADYQFNYARMLRTEKYRPLFSWILEKTNYITEDWINFSSRLYLALHDMNALPTCKTCGKQLKKNISSMQMGFPNYCGPKCAALNNEVQTKLRKTTFEKYGVENASSSPLIRKKVKNTCKARYGVENIAQLPETI